jgi:hypothetical protein
MSFTHKVGQSYTTAAGTVKSVTSTYTSDFEVGLDDTVAATTTNKEFDVALTRANLQSMVLTCDKAVTVKTNSTSSPQETISLTAGQAIIWAHDHTESAPFAGNVTKFYVTNAGSADARFQFSALLNQGV